MQFAVKLQHKHPHKLPKAVEEQLKHKLNDQPNEKVGNGIAIDPSMLRVTRDDATAYFAFVNDMEQVSTEEKQRIHTLIAHSVKKPAGGTTDYFVMDYAQTKAQLQLIANELIPAQYKGKMEEAINQYENDSLGFQVRMYEVAQQKMDALRAAYPTLEKSDILANGVNKLQQLQQWTTTLYSTLDHSTHATFVQSFEAALNEFKENQLQTNNSPEEAVHRYQQELRSKWNDFATVFPKATLYKLPTASNPIMNIQV